MPEQALNEVFRFLFGGTGGFILLTAYLVEKFIWRRGVRSVGENLREAGFVIQSKRNSYERYRRFSASAFQPRLISDLVSNSETRKLAPLSLMFYSQARLTPSLFGEVKVQHVPGELLPKMSDKLISFSRSLMVNNKSESYKNLRDFTIASYYFKAAKNIVELHDILGALRESPDIRQKFVRSGLDSCDSSINELQLGRIGEFCEDWRKSIGIDEANGPKILDPDVLFVHLAIYRSYRLLRSYAPEYLGEAREQEVRTFANGIKSVLQSVEEENYSSVYDSLIDLDNYSYEVSVTETIPKFGE